MVVLRERYIENSHFLNYENIDFEEHDIYVPEHPKQEAQETRKTELWQERQRKVQAVCKCTARVESYKKI